MFAFPMSILYDYYNDVCVYLFIFYSTLLKVYTLLYYSTT